MGIYDSELWLSDVDETVGALPELQELAGKTVLVTGCTGLVCSAVVDVLIRWNEGHEEKIAILAAGRNIQKIRNRFSPYDAKAWFQSVPFDAATGAGFLDKPCDYIIHGASNASPDRIVNEPVETMLSNFVGTKCLLDYGRRHSVNRLLYVSSSEVYGLKEGERPYKTNEYGYIDLLNSRNSYSVGKRAAETLCASYAKEYGTDVVIVRPGHIYGPTAAETDVRVSSAWAYAAARGEDIVMKSDGAQIRSYCYCLDCAAAILKVLLKGRSVRAYNISNPDSIINVRGIGEILARAGGAKLVMVRPTDAEKKGFNPMSNSSLDSEELLALGWKGRFDAERGFSHTVAILKEMVQR